MQQIAKKTLAIKITKRLELNLINFLVNKDFFFSLFHTYADELKFNIFRTNWENHHVEKV